MPPRYTDEFKIEAVKQVTVNGYSIKETAERLGVNVESLRSWIKKFESPEAREKYSIEQSANAEIKRLQKELKRVPAALLHDIGKPFVAYQNDKNTLTDEYSFTNREEISNQNYKKVVSIILYKVTCSLSLIS